VRGSAYDRGRRNTGSFAMGKKSPQRKIIGKRRKSENVWASKTSLAATATKSPRNVDATPISATAGRKVPRASPDRSARKAAIATGTNALAMPKRIAPLVFASMDVVPSSTETATTPGRSVGMLSRPLPDRTKDIPVHASGKMIPQLTFGGFRQ